MKHKPLATSPKEIVVSAEVKSELLFAANKSKNRNGNIKEDWVAV